MLRNFLNLFGALVPRPPPSPTDALPQPSREKPSQAAAIDDKIMVRVSSDIRMAIERLQSDHPALLASTEAACRHIIADWLQSHAYLAGPRAVADGDPPGEAFAAEETANRIAQRIRASLVEQLPQEDVESTAARDRRPPAAGEFEVLFAPVWDARRQFTPFNRCFFDASFSRLRAR
jgi:hypothetical protein